MIVFVAELTSDQATELSTLQYTDDSFFNPFEHDGNWYISEIEVLNCDFITWVRRLPLIEIDISQE